MVLVSTVSESYADRSPFIPNFKLCRPNGVCLLNISSSSNGTWCVSADACFDGAPDNTIWKTL
jgi:hypothetical protein